MIASVKDTFRFVLTLGFGKLFAPIISPEN